MCVCVYVNTIFGLHGNNKNLKKNNNDFEIKDEETQHIKTYHGRNSICFHTFVLYLLNGLKLID